MYVCILCTKWIKEELPLDLKMSIIISYFKQFDLQDEVFFLSRHIYNSVFFISSIQERSSSARHFVCLSVYHHLFFFIAQLPSLSDKFQAQLRYFAGFCRAKYFVLFIAQLPQIFKQQQNDNITFILLFEQSTQILNNRYYTMRTFKKKIVYFFLTYKLYIYIYA